MAEVTFSKNNAFQIIIIILILTGVVIMGIYFLKILPDQQESELEFEKQKYEEQKLADEQEKAEKEQNEFLQKLEEEEEESEREKNLYECYENATNNYLKNWKTECERLGRPLLDDGSCILPEFNVNVQNESYKNAQDTCLKLFGGD